MTSTKKICVCGKERGKEPVLITITTCKNKHTFKVTKHGQIEKLPPPLATSSQLAIQTTPTTPINSASKSKIEPKTNDLLENDSAESEKHQSGIPNQSKVPKDENIDEELYQRAQENSQEIVANKHTDEILTPKEEAPQEYATADEANKLEDESNNENPENFATEDSDKKEYKIENDKRNHIEDATDEDGAKNKTTAENETTPEDEITPENIDENIDDNTEEATDNENAKNVFYVTETAINTMPYLGPLLNVTTKLKNENDIDVSCGMEIYILEKHSKKCRHQQADKDNADSVVVDGTDSFKILGKVVFPTCDEYDVNLSQKVDKFTQALMEPKPHHATVDKLKGTLDKYSLNKVLDRISRSSKVFDKGLLTLHDSYNDDDSLDTSEKEDKAEFQRKHTRDQGNQFNYFLKLRKSRKWYHSFLECLGLKETEDFLNQRHFIIRKSGSSTIPQSENNADIRKYLVI